MRAGDRRAVRLGARHLFRGAGRSRSIEEVAMGETARHARAASRPDRPSQSCSCPLRTRLRATQVPSTPPISLPSAAQTDDSCRGPSRPGARVPGFRLTPGQATALATEALTPHGSVRRFETRTRTGPGVPRQWQVDYFDGGGRGRRAGGDRRQRGMRGGDVDRDPGRHQARPGIPGRGLGQGEQLVDLAATLRSLHGAVRRPEAAASPDPSRPAGAAGLQRLTRLLQPREGRSLGRARLSGAGLRLLADAGRRVQAVREPRPAPAAGVTELAGRPASSPWPPSTLPTSRPKGR